MVCMSLTIRSGGQTGVDRAALDVAVALGLPYVGWCPSGGWAEDLADPPGVSALYAELVPTPSADPRQRTAWNVRDSDETMLLVPDATFDASPGTRFTKFCADVLYEKPCHVVALDQPDPGLEIRRWLTALDSEGPSRSFCVNVAGPRESEAPGIYRSAVAVLRDVLADGS